jgi:ATP synthase protein I
MTQRPDEEAPPDPQHGAGRAPLKAAGPPTWVAMSGLGFEFVAAVLLPGALGWWLDRMAGTAPWLMLAGGILGFVVGLRLLMNAAKRGAGRK